MDLFKARVQSLATFLFSSNPLQKPEGEVCEDQAAVGPNFSAYRQRGSLMLGGFLPAPRPPPQQIYLTPSDDKRKQLFSTHVTFSLKGPLQIAHNLFCRLGQVLPNGSRMVEHRHLAFDGESYGKFGTIGIPSLQGFAKAMEKIFDRKRKIQKLFIKLQSILKIVSKMEPSWLLSRLENKMPKVETAVAGTPASEGAIVASADATSQLPANIADNDLFGAYAGAGMENVTLSDILIPRFSILQDLSPQLKDTKPEYIEGAKAGQICDVGTGEVIGDALIFVPVHYAKVWLEWYPRKSGKGLATIHHDPSIMEKTVKNEDTGLNILKNGNSVAETHQLYGLALLGASGSPRQSFIPFGGSQIKKCKKLLTMATSERILTSAGEINPPLFYRYYVFSVAPESNVQGDWHGWKIDRGEPIPTLPNAKTIMSMALKMREQIDAGIIKADMSQEDAMEQMSAENSARAAGAKNEERM